MKNKKVILIVAIILVVLFVGGILWFIFSKDQDSNKKTVAINEIVDNLPIYTNEKLGIQFEYPKTLRDVTESIYDYTQDGNQLPFTGKAIVLAVKFSENSTIYIEGVSPDFNQMYIQGYKGNTDLASKCGNPNVIENESYCINKDVANQNTYDRIYFEAPECSPHFVREVKLNSNNSNYPGIRIFQSFDTDGKWDCGSSEEEFAIVTDTELKRLIEEKQQSDLEKQKMANFDQLLKSFRFIE